MNLRSIEAFEHESEAPSPVDQDRALVAGMLRGSERAWRDFHGRYARLVFRCITKVTVRFAKSVSPEDVREIYATLLVQLLANDMHKLRSFDPDRGSRFSSWVGLLAVNCAYDYLRSVRRELGRAPLSEAEFLPCDRPSPLDTFESKERADRVARATTAFSTKDREFLALYFGEGLEPEEIAERMRISVKTVYSKKHKIQSRLEAMLCDAPLAACA